MTEPFTVVGIGDMSGDVFGNGMLYTPQIKLVCAFDHRHVFIDPDPDPAASFAERQRLFTTPGSTLGRLRPLADLGGRRRDRSRAPRASRCRPRPARRSAIDDDAPAEMTPAEVIHRALQAPGRPAVERRHRHLREGDARGPHRGRRPCQRPAARQRRPGAGPGRGRRRQPRVHPAWPHRVRAHRRAHQHRLHRQLGGRRHVRPRGEHQDPARSRRCSAASSRWRSATSCCRRAPTTSSTHVLYDNYQQAQILSQEMEVARPAHRGLRGPDAAARGRRRRARARGGVPAVVRGDGRAPAGRRGARATRARRAARVREARDLRRAASTRTCPTRPTWPRTFAAYFPPASWSGSGTCSRTIRCAAS